VIPAVAHVDFTIVVLGMRGHLQLVVVYPRTEVDPAKVDEFMGKLDDLLVGIAGASSIDATDGARTGLA
jgi:hypothetical protein